MVFYTGSELSCTEETAPTMEVAASVHSVIRQSRSCPTVGSTSARVGVYLPKGGWVPAQEIAQQLSKLPGKMNKKFDFKSISSSQACVMGNLQRLLSQGEYHPFTSVLLFESKFVEVNERGESISLHNRPSYVTIGICAASPSSPMPNAMLIAREEPVSLQEIMTNFWKLSEQLSHMEHLVLTRLFPLKVVELSVHSTDKHHLMLKLVNGHSHYLELCAPPDQQQHLFHQWLQLIALLKPPENTGNTEVNVKSKDFVMHHKGAPSSNNSSENRDSPRGVPNPKTEEKVITKQSSSKQVALSGTVGTTEEGGRKGEAFCSSLKPTKQGTTLQSNNIVPLDTKKSKTTENRQTRTKTGKQSGKKLLTSGNQESGSKSLLQLISQVISKQGGIKGNKAKHPGHQMQLEKGKDVHTKEKIPLQTSFHS